VGDERAVATEVEVESLADHIELVDLISHWHWKEWGVEEIAGSEAEWRDALQSRAARVGFPFTLVAFVARAPVGSVSVCWDDVDIDFAEHGPWISGMYVHPSARDFGVGRRLLAAAESRCRQEGVRELWLHTNEAQRFYERCGWTTVRAKTPLGHDAVMRHDVVMFVPDDFSVPSGLDAGWCQLRPLAVSDSVSDYRARHNSVEHIRATPGFAGRDWPTDDYTIERNTADLAAHADDFAARRGFTYTVVRGGTDEVIGCVYLYPPAASDAPATDVAVRSWVRSDHAARDRDLYELVSGWLRDAWPFANPSYARRS
jgi:GNAT superfamily N-acetyltransferase